MLTFNYDSQQQPQLVLAGHCLHNYAHNNDSGTKAFLYIRTHVYEKGGSIHKTATTTTAICPAAVEDMSRDWTPAGKKEAGKDTRTPS